MATAVQLSVLTGPHKDRRFCVFPPSQCKIGRAKDCLVNLSGTQRDELISRHHCQLDVGPRFVRLRDLGSTNGTFVNGLEIQASLKSHFERAGCALNHGDLITIGGMTLRIEFVDFPRGHDHGAGVPTWPGKETAIKDCGLSALNGSCFN
jgi:eukaryotic-like serine/threonine-protein kinase